MSNFVNAIEQKTNYTLTENGAVAKKDTGSDVLNFFAISGAIRDRSKEEVEELFFKAFAEDNLLAMKALFQTRDIRGGNGERKVFRTILKYMAENHSKVIMKNLYLIPEFGRWDDLLILLDTPLKSITLDFILQQLKVDWKDMKAGQTISLLGKWLPSINTSSVHTKTLAKMLVKEFKTTEKKYRKVLSALRGYIKVTEKAMSSNSWESIVYPSVPSKAMNNYRTAFYKRDEERFTEYIENVKKGTEKINSGTLYPYDILEKAGLTWDYVEKTGYRTASTFSLFSPDDVLEEQWKALPNYVEGENNIIVMADTSGSMAGRPIQTSIGLAIYFAERNKGAYANKFMTFSGEPSWVELKGTKLSEKVRCVPSIVSNTDMFAGFDLILNTALEYNIAPEEMPKALVVISDMEFDDCQYYRRESFSGTLHDETKAKFNRFGYELPNLVYWNVESRNDVFQVSKDDLGIQLYSGQSPSTFKGLVGNIGKTPYEAMLGVLNSDRYAPVRA